MDLIVYAPTAKGIKAGLNEHSRIMFLNEHYIHITPCKHGYRFSQGDAFEWKPGMKNPDSYWKADCEVETTTIIDSALISDYNKDTNKNELKLMGIT